MVVDIMYECADICEHEFDVEVELGMLGLRVNYTMSNALSVIVWKVIAVTTWPEKSLFCATSVDARTSQQACWLDKHLNLAIMKENLYWQQF